MLWPLEFVEHGDGVVLECYEALALRVRQELIGGGSVLSGALAGRNFRSWTQVRPVQTFRLAAPDRECFASFARLFAVGFRKVRQIRKRFSRRHLETACSSDVENAFHSSGAKAFDQ